jgi:hypothetical protein
LLAHRQAYVASRSLDRPADHGKISEGSVWSSRVLGGSDAHLELALDCLGGEFTLPGVGDASSSGLRPGDAVLLPPPSYWIGLGRPPPAPNWQQFADDLGRRRPPPKPNWRPLLRPSPSYFSVAHLHSHFHHQTPQFTFSIGRFGASFTQRKCIELSWSLFMVGKQYFILFGNNWLLWVYRLPIPLAFPWSFDTWILCHKDPAGSIGCFGSQSTSTLFVHFSESIPFPMFIRAFWRSSTIQSFCFFLFDSLILSSSKSGGFIGYDSRLRYVVYS